MPVNYLISATLSETDKSAVLTSVNDIQTKLPFLISLTEKQRKQQRKAASKRQGYIKDVADTVNTFPAALPAGFDANEFRKDVNLYSSLGELHTAVAALFEKIDDTMMQLSSELMSQSDAAYGYLKTGAKNNAGLKTAVDKIGQAFTSQGKRKTKKAA